MLIYFAAKAFVVDLTNWTPNYGIVGYLFAFLSRFGTKILVDWTFFVQACSPIEVGGVRFCWSLLYTVVIGLTSAINVDEIQGPFEKATITNVMIGNCFGLLVLFASSSAQSTRITLTLSLTKRQQPPTFRRCLRRMKKMRRRLASLLAMSRS